MSTVTSRHYDQARRNRALAEELLREHGDSEIHVQWAVVAAFYCAVHCMQGYLVSIGRDPRTHVRRADEIADPACHVPSEVQREYEALKQISEKARYRLGTFEPSWVQQKIIDGRLKLVTDFVSL